MDYGLYLKCQHEQNVDIKQENEIEIKGQKMRRNEWLFIDDKR